ncbi:LytTR family DNA-binding domain-containing protein [Sphingomonas sp. G-3-2-10]|jgi:two-component system LytT family response regulator|uniref:LytR/AlgR family response regulator transcription factor n=1 Tax=Sphingomonas sp. G-3-2-10 TaxID=2728838 RepID=UPI00146B0898|nr:LytTR family DNA-binding domain-containing protein [Sphingomonas sp. G-3-2-10]NML04477.1 response regulator transcription factor [Sphingomonas sp. G-3-2-10]
MSTRVIIVDDEPPARERLARMLAEIGGLTIVGEASDGTSALALLNDTRPDIAFVDINMPGGSGLDMLRASPPDARPAVVLVTAHIDFAVEALDLDVADYVVKPYTLERLRQACRRAQLLGRPAAPAISWVAARDAGDLVTLLPQDVMAVLAEGNYVRILTQHAGYMVRSTLKQMQERLAGHGFVAISRSAIVAVRWIERLSRDRHGDGELTLRSGETMRVSRSFRRDVETALQG